jgi:hypothetical protein
MIRRFTIDAAASKEMHEMFFNHLDTRVEPATRRLISTTRPVWPETV